MGTDTLKNEESENEIRRKPVVPQDLIAAKVGSKNTVYAAIRSGEIETFRLGGKIIIAPEWVSKNLGW